MIYKTLLILTLYCFAQSTLPAQNFDYHKHSAAFGSTRPITTPRKPLSPDQRYQFHRQHLDAARKEIKATVELKAEEIFPYNPTMQHFCNTTSLFQELIPTKLDRAQIKARIWLAVQFYIKYKNPSPADLQEVSRHHDTMIDAITNFQRRIRCGSYRSDRSRNKIVNFPYFSKKEQS